MNKTVRIIIPIILIAAIIFCTAWYLLIYDQSFTRDMLLTFARYSENNGNHDAATWFYNLAYAQAEDNDHVAIELAQQYKASGNYTKAEYTLYNAISDGGGVALYIELCKTFVEQDKLLDAVNMLNGIQKEDIKSQIEAIRPAKPTASPQPGFYSQYISVTLECNDATIYATTNGEYPSVKDVPYAGPIALTDGDNTIYALSIGSNGLVSPLAIYGYTIGGVIQEINFNDSAIESEVRTLLNADDDAILYNNDLWKIKEFTIPSGAKNYTDIQHMIFLEKLVIEKGVSGELNDLFHFANLTELSIKNTSVSQDALTGIAALPKLNTLTLQSCKISSIAPLSKAGELVILDLSSNSISSLKPLTQLKKLQELTIANNVVTDVSALSSVVTLTKLDLSSNAVTSLSPLSNLTALTWLDAGTNNINKLGALNKLTSLSYLSLKNNKLTDVNVIANCTALTVLDVSTNQLTDITALNSLVQLTAFDFSYNKVTKLPKFPTSCALITIKGENNGLSSLDNLSGLKNLNYIYMDYNKNISSVKSLAKCPLLIEVNIYGTKVKNVKDLTEQSIIVNYNPVK